MNYEHTKIPSTNWREVESTEQTFYTIIIIVPIIVTWVESPNLPKSLKYGDFVSLSQRVIVDIPSLKTLRPSPL